MLAGSQALGLLRVWVWAWVVVGWGWPALSAAHDIPNARIDRATQVTLRAGRLEVDYEVSLAELTLAQDLRQLDPDAAVSSEGGRTALFERYAQTVGPLNARGVLVRVDEAEVDLAVVGHDLTVEDHPRFTFHLTAPLPPRGHLTLLDTNYASAEGPVRLACRVASDLTVQGDLPPTDLASIPVRATWQLTDREEAASRRLVLDYQPATVAIAPELGIAPPPPSPPARASSPAPAARPGRSGLTWLLDPATPGAAGAWLVAALGLGLAHAVQPGHGKTLIAAASLGGAGSARRGVALGALTALVHLASVAALAALLWTLDLRRYDWLQGWLTRGAGLLVAVVGSFRLGRTLGGAADHDAHLGTAARGGSASLGTLAVAGGAVPCWDAVALIVVAHAAGRLAWGLALLVAFSLGLATVLVAVGWLAGRFRGRVGLADPSVTDPRARWLGGLAALVLLGIGLSLLVRS